MPFSFSAVSLRAQRPSSLPSKHVGPSRSASIPCALDHARPLSGSAAVPAMRVGRAASAAGGLPAAPAPLSGAPVERLCGRAHAANAVERLRPQPYAYRWRLSSARPSSCVSRSASAVHELAYIAVRARAVEGRRSLGLGPSGHIETHLPPGSTLSTGQSCFGVAEASGQRASRYHAVYPQNSIATQGGARDFLRPRKSTVYASKSKYSALRASFSERDRGRNRLLYFITR